MNQAKVHPSLVFDVGEYLLIASCRVRVKVVCVYNKMISLRQR